MKLQELYKHFLSSPESMWVMEYPNAVDLYNWVKEHPIKKILDLGTGIGVSSSVIALALKDKGESGHIDSVEQFDKCIALANKMIPEELKGYITIHKSDVQVWQTDKIPYQHFSTFKNLPEGDYDLIIVDGPALFLQGNSLIDLPNGDIIKLLLEGKLKAGTQIVYDGRILSLRIIERYFFDNFLTLKVPKRGSDFNLFERNDSPMVFRDKLLDEMEKTTPYFKNEKDNPTSHLQGASSTPKVAS